jgi:hypothetical protein
MSLKYFARKIGDAHYVLPHAGKMRVDAHAFFSESLFERTEESMWQQLASAAAYEGVIGAYLMPDEPRTDPTRQEGPVENRSSSQRKEREDEQQRRKG